MNYQMLKQQRESFSGTDDEFIIYANATIYARSVRYISVRTVWDLLGSAKATAVAGAVQQFSAIAYQMFITPGDELGTGGGIDISLPDAQGMVDMLIGYGILTSDEGEMVKNLGRKASIRCKAWGFTSIDANSLVLANRLPSIDALRAALASRYNMAISVLSVQYNSDVAIIDAIAADVNAVIPDSIEDIS